MIVEQKARQSLAFSDYAYILDMGRNRYEGRGDEMLHDPAVIDLYLGGGRKLIKPMAPEQIEELRGDDPNGVVAGTEG